MAEFTHDIDSLEGEELQRYQNILKGIHSRHVFHGNPNLATLAINDDQIATISLEPGKIVIAIDNVGIAEISEDGSTKRPFKYLTEYLVMADQEDEGSNEKKYVRILQEIHTKFARGSDTAVLTSADGRIGSISLVNDLFVLYIDGKGKTSIFLDGSSENSDQIESFVQWLLSAGNDFDEGETLIMLRVLREASDACDGVLKDE